MTQDQSPAKPRERLPHEVWVLAVVGLVIAIGFGVMSPVLPIYARTFGVSSFLIGLVTSSLSILRLSTMPVSSWLLRFTGPRELAIIGCILVGFPTFMIGISNSYWGVLIWRGLSGFGSALYGVSAMALLFAVSPPHQRGRANAVYGGGFVIGAMIGPAVGGLIVAISLNAPFYFYAVALAISAIILVIFLPRTDAPARKEVRNRGAGLVGLIKDNRFRAVIVVQFSNGWQSWGVRALLVPLFVVEVAQKSTTWAGIAFAIAATAQAACLPLAGWGTDHLGRRPMLLIGCALTGTMSVGFALTNSYLVLVILMCIYSIGVSFLGSSAQAMLADTVPTSTPSGIAAFQMAGDSGAILGPLVAGAVLDLASMPIAWLIGAGFITIAGVMTWITPSAIRPPAVMK